MAERIGSYTWADVNNVIGKTISKVAEDDFAAAYCNIALNMVWKRYDWRESLQNLPPFYLVPNTQDHGAPAVIIPSDFMGLRQAYLSRIDINPATRQELTIVKNLRVTYLVGFPRSIDFESAAKAFRIFPRVPRNIG